MPMPAVNLLPPEMRPRRRQMRKRYAYGLAALLLAVLLVAYDLRLVSEVRALGRDAEAMRRSALALQPIMRQRQALEAEAAALKDRQARYQGLGRGTWNVVWRDLAAVLPGGVTLTAIGTAEGGVTLSGTTVGLPALAEAEERLATVAGVRQVAVVTVRGGRSGPLEFELRVLVNRGPAAGAAAAAAPAGGVTP